MLETISVFVRDFILGVTFLVSALLSLFNVTKTAEVSLNVPGAPLSLDTDTNTTPKLATPSIALEVEEEMPNLSTDVPPTTSVAVVPQTPLNPPAIALKTLEEVNGPTRAALTNIVCTTAAGGPLNALSGSGVFIDNRGIILTNAHIAQYFLLYDYPRLGNVECVIRTGAPAQPKYRATLLYLPPVWVEANGEKITVTSPTGTGENDYAFLLVTGLVSSGTSLPSSFPSIPISIAEPRLGDYAFLAAYPAGFLDGTTIAMNLFITSALATVKEIYTFDGGPQIDLISVGGTIVSQGGSSGGAMVRMTDGALSGIIVTASLAGATTAERDLRAITLAHIDRSLAKQGEGGISTLLSGNINTKATQFNQTTAPALKKILVDALEN